MPYLDPDQALILVATLEKAIDAIWRAHGDAMADRLAASGVQLHRPYGAVWATGNGAPPTDADFDF